jgi:cation diffusion facilitator family transporter
MSGGGHHGHGHDPARAAGETLSGSTQGIRAVAISLVGLGLTAILQGVVVAFTGSVALLADTIHNLSDALTGIPLWIAFRLGRRPPNHRYPYGYHRAEDLAGILIVSVIAGSAVVAAWEAVRRLVDPRQIENAPWVLVAGLVGCAGNALVAEYRIRVGRRIGSAALEADGHHARVDALTSLVVVVGTLGSMAGFERADPIAGLGITVVILFVLRGAARTVLRRVMDGIDEPTIHVLEDVAAGVPGVEHVTGARARWAGHGLNAELEIDVDRDLTVAEGHTIAEEVRHRLHHELPRLRAVAVHVDPHTHEGEDPHGSTAHHTR